MSQPSSIFNVSNKSRRFSTLCTAIVMSLAATASIAVDKNYSDPALASVMQRDLGLSADQLNQYAQVESISGQTTAAMAESLGDSYAGSWLERSSDGSYKMVVASTDPGAASAMARTVTENVEMRSARYSLKQLESAKALLDAMVLGDGDANTFAATSRKINQKGIHSWYVDVPNNSVVMSYGSYGIANAIDMVATSGIDVRMLRLKRDIGTPEPLISIIGGISWSGCSVGFSASVTDGRKGFITAGHCGPAGTSVTIGGTRVGSVLESGWPRFDRAFAQVRSSDTLVASVRGPNGSSIAIRGSQRAAIGAAICRSGRTTGWQCGTIRARDVTVNYTSTPSIGLIEATACAGRGDSGGSWVSGSQGQGVTSGGNLPAGRNDNCSLQPAQRRTWYYPLDSILSAYGGQVRLTTQ